MSDPVAAQGAAYRVPKARPLSDFPRNTSEFPGKPQKVFERGHLQLPCIVCLANSHSGAGRRLEKPSAIPFPHMCIKCGTGRTRLASLFRQRVPGERWMNATAVAVDAECLQLALKVERIPEKCAIEKLATNGADQTVHKRMRNRHIWNRLDLVDRKHAQVGEPALKAKQRIVVGAGVLRK